WVKPGLGEIKAAIARTRSSCLSGASASNEITRFSSAITRTRSCTNSAFVNSGISYCISEEIWASCGPQGPAPPSLSHLERAAWRCCEGSDESDFKSRMIWVPETFDTQLQLPQ